MVIGCQETQLDPLLFDIFIIWNYRDPKVQESRDVFWEFLRDLIGKSDVGLVDNHEHFKVDVVRVLPIGSINTP